LDNKSHTLSDLEDRRMIAFANCYLSRGKSGGDACFVKIARIMPFSKIVITSKFGAERFKGDGLEAEYLITTKARKIRNIYVVYLYRILRGMFIRINVPPGSILYTTSEFLPDVIPSFCQKLRHRNAFWVQKIFHLVPADRFVSSRAQCISLVLIRKFADLVIVDNRALRNELVKLGFDISKIEINTPGVDADYFANVKTCPNSPYDATCLARLHPSKGIFDLIEIWKRVCDKKPNARLAVIGGGSDKNKQALEDAIDKAGLGDAIHILGFLDDNEAFGIIKTGKVFVFPSHEEGFGMAVLEAMACGLPVVAWDLPVYEEHFSGAVSCVPMAQYDDFADKVIAYLDSVGNNEVSVERRKTIVARYDWRRIAQRELEQITRICT
jgi:glycosyltransferase involved in cell wall biosynthesis